MDAGVEFVTVKGEPEEGGLLVGEISKNQSAQEIVQDHTQSEIKVKEEVNIDNATFSSADFTEVRILPRSNQENHVLSSFNYGSNLNSKDSEDWNINIKQEACDVSISECDSPSLPDRTTVSLGSSGACVMEQITAEDNLTTGISDDGRYKETSTIKEEEDETELSQYVEVHVDNNPALNSDNKAEYLQLDSSQSSGESRYVCEECNKSLANKYILREHLLTHTGIKPHICEFCKMEFRMRSVLKRHLLTHKTEKTHSCQHCNKQFYRKTDLITHQFKHTSDKPYGCKKCNISFIYKSSYRTHLLTHSNQPLFTCEFCGKGFYVKLTFDRHLVTHTGTKEFVCQHCQKTFSRKSILVTHLVTHTDAKPHVCSFCGRGFARKSYLDSHLHIHTGIKRYMCIHCNKSFGQKGNLNEHIRAMHKEYSNQRL